MIWAGQKTISGTKNDIRDKKQYQGDISFLCPPIINLIKAQVCDNTVYHYCGFGILPPSSAEALYHFIHI